MGKLEKLINISITRFLVYTHKLVFPMAVVREIDIKFKFKDIDCEITGQTLDCPEKVARVFDFLKFETKEHFLVANLTSQNQINAYEVVGIGTVDTVALRTSEILRSAILTNMPTVVLVHNHPSGISKPSDSDIRFTSKVIAAAKHFDIEVLDHVVIGKDEFTSIKKGRLELFI